MSKKISLKLDARKYNWVHVDGNGPFGILGILRGRVSVGDVEFDKDTFELMSYTKNGTSLSFYGDVRPNEHAALMLDDGTILFCIVSGSSFMGTDHSADDVRMKYYFLTPL